MIVPGDMVVVSQSTNTEEPLLITRATGHAGKDNEITGTVFMDDVCTVLATSRSALGNELFIMTSNGNIGWAMIRPFKKVHDDAGS